jgi:hypothetical protein
MVIVAVATQNTPPIIHVQTTTNFTLQSTMDSLFLKIHTTHTKFIRTKIEACRGSFSIRTIFCNLNCDDSFRFYQKSSVNVTISFDDVTTATVCNQTICSSENIYYVTIFPLVPNTVLTFYLYSNDLTFYNTNLSISYKDGNFSWQKASYNDSFNNLYYQLYYLRLDMQSDNINMNTVCGMRNFSKTLTMNNQTTSAIFSTTDGYTYRVNIVAYVTDERGKWIDSISYIPLDIRFEDAYVSPLSIIIGVLLSLLSTSVLMGTIVILVISALMKHK